MSKVSEFIATLEERRSISLKNAHLPLFNGEAIAYKDTIELATFLLLDEQPTINENQQEYLNAFKEAYTANASISMTIWSMSQSHLDNSLDNKQKAQVLRAFAEWVIESEGES